MSSSTSAMRQDTPPITLPVTLEERFAAQSFLEHEAELLDHEQVHDWLALLADDIHYVVPIRVTRRRGHPDVVNEMFHYEDDHASLSLRVRRLDTDVAWAEDPPSHTRRFVTNVRVQRGDHPGEYRVRSYLLVFRSRGDQPRPDLISAERFDLLRQTADGTRLAERRVILDESSVGTKNLGIFL